MTTLILCNAKRTDQTMKLNLLFLLSTLAVVTSCSGQNISGQATHTIRDPHAIPAVTGTTGDTVKETGNNIMTIYQDKKNKYWFGSWEDGLYSYDGTTMLHYTTKHGLPHNRVEDLQEDRWGNIYFNTPGGVCKFDGQNFSTLNTVESDEWKLQPGDVWFKSLQFSGKVYRYDGKIMHSLTFPKCKLGEDWIAKHPTHSSPYAIYTIYTDSKGNIWFGTAVLGACRYDGKSFDWISEDDVTELHYGPSNGVRSIIEDKDGYFWFNSAYRYAVYGNKDIQPHTFYRREKSLGNLDGSPDSDFWEYMSIARDNDNALWIATYWNGVWRYDGKKTTYYPVQAGGEDITMFYIYKDNSGVLWLGTHENGVYKFNGTSFERFKP